MIRRPCLGLLAAVVLSACAGGPAPSDIMSSMLADNTATPTPGPVIELPASQRLTYTIGPFDLPAGQSADVMRTNPGMLKFQVAEPIWATEFEFRLEESSGDRLPNSLLHTAIITNQSELNELCTTKKVGNTIAAATATLSRIELPEGFGYPITTDHQLEAKAILRNPTSQDFHNVFLIFTIKGDSLTSGKTLKNVSPLHLDFDPCDHNPINIEPNAFAQRTAAFSAPAAGLIYKAYGMLQDFGVSVSLSNGSGAPFWEGVASIDSDHQIIELPPFETEEGVSISRGDELTLGVTYDNATDEWHNNATAAALVYVETSPEEQKAARLQAASANQQLLQ